MTKRTSPLLRAVQSANCRYNNARRWKKSESLIRELYNEWQQAQADYIESELCGPACAEFRLRFPDVFQETLDSVRRLECNSQTKVRVVYNDGTESYVLLNDIMHGFCIMSRHENIRLALDSKVRIRKVRGMTPKELEHQKLAGSKGGANRWKNYVK